VHFDARVLVVEDNAVNQDVATGILESMGCRVATAANGSVAVQLFPREKFDLILMDCEMPVMDGFEATRRIREVETALNGLRGIEDDARVPIVALTAHALTEVRERCLRAGMDDFLVKPFDEAQMADMLGRWLTPGDAAAAVPEAMSPTATEASAIPPAATRPSSIDGQAIERIRAISGEKGEALLQRVVAQFAATAPPLAAMMRSKARDGDPDAVWRAAHNLKSSAGALGAFRVSDRCAEIEVIARENGTLPSGELLAELDAALVAATRELHELIAAGAPA
jgi:two-component system sensor histidine kinase/response regulator